MTRSEQQHRARGVAALFSLTAAWGAALLFILEPMVARKLLPLLGGSPAVWNTSMVFFQLALIVGYGIAHLAASRAGRRVGAVGILTLVVTGVAWLPVNLPSGWRPPLLDGQVWWVLAVLTVMIGVPFVALATLSPTLQQWFARSEVGGGRDPYFLYAAGNAGSAVGLLAYPIVLEPLVGLRAQSTIWAGAYGLLIVLVGACMWVSRRQMQGPTVSDQSLDMPVQVQGNVRRSRTRWIVLSAVPSGLLLAVTRHLSTDVGALPLLWIIPLLVYLTTFVVAFARPNPTPSRRLIAATKMVTVALAALLIGQGVGSLYATASMAMHVLAFGVLALFCHQLLAASRPDPQRLTEFYFWVSVGGALGGIAVALVAPLVFTRVTEYPLLVLFALCILFANGKGETIAKRASVAAGIVAVTIMIAIGIGIAAPSNVALIADALAVGGAVLYLVTRNTRVFASAMAVLISTSIWIDHPNSLKASRTFFGVYRVQDIDGVHSFVHGTTIHGQQQFAPRLSDEPLTYYTRTSPIGRLLAAMHIDQPVQDVAVVGLGAGTIAAYGRQGDHMQFIEIDQAVVEIAKDPQLFRFLQDSKADVDITIADGRVAMESDERQYDLVVLDAFSSDAIPVHLLTFEAMTSYRARLTSGGVIAVHISNRFFDLGPALARVAGELEMDSRILKADGSTWFVLASPMGVGEATVSELNTWDEPTSDSSSRLWTDDYSNVLGALK